MIRCVLQCVKRILLKELTQFGSCDTLKTGVETDSLLVFVRSGWACMRRLWRKCVKSIHSKQAGLTSVQILVVVVILGIIAAVLLAPRLLGQAGRALQAQAAEDIETLGIALDRYAKDNGDYPSTQQGLKALWEKPEAVPIPINWTIPYIHIPITEDPWGNPYVYVRPGSHDRYGYDLISFGSDGVEGGTGEAEDVVSWIRRDE